MSLHSIFSTSVFGPSSAGGKNQAAVGFSQVFATMLAKQMRNAMAGNGEGPLGTGGGTTGDIYGTFFDEAMGQALANAPAMKPLNQMIERELIGPHHLSRARAGNGGTIVSNSHTAHVPGVTQNNTGSDLASDSQGPLLLPPEPTAVASVLLPPPRLEG